ncbi:tetratricopeptide repeat protein [Nocardiopsis composta]|uniref:Tetratricopeptide (TPR) repeat protein n=1 Tax=Nocardiopsis composta TaxID=157465 RepID=A0A7W8QMA4_9ACTN|nr:hypothetical protein [Nocardiopsis composta]MBB5432405.1 tetratricopeptide (TPR) repeat protein [Nocardiopsis composta]
MSEPQETPRDVREEMRLLLDEGDPGAVLRRLRQDLGAFGTAELAGVLARLAEDAGFDDLAQSAGRVAADPADPRARYEFGYACVERGAAFAAVPVLRELQAEAPASPAVLRELASALEDEGRHAEAADALQHALERGEAPLEDWPDRYLLGYNALLAGRVDLAAEVAGALAPPPDDAWLPARERLAGMVRRALAVRENGGLDLRDLRGWHFALTGGLLLELSPFGYDEGMNGRYAMVSDDYDACGRALRLLIRVMDATGHRPGSVGLLPDRSSRALGLAAAGLLGVAAEPFTGPRPGQLVVAYDLGDSEHGLLEALRERAPGQVLFERSTCWTEPPAVPADVTGWLVQTVLAPWAENMRFHPETGAERIPADDRPAEALAEEIAAAAAAPGGAPESGAGEDGEPPFDPEERVLAFAAAVRGLWLTGSRPPMPSSGPVPGNSFT